MLIFLSDPVFSCLLSAVALFHYISRSCAASTCAKSHQPPSETRNIANEPFADRLRVRFENLRFFANMRLKANDIKNSYKIFYGPERDMKNFPPPTFISDKALPVKYKFVPYSIFNFIERHTGTSGNSIFVGWLQV